MPEPTTVAADIVAIALSGISLAGILIRWGKSQRRFEEHSEALRKINTKLDGFGPEFVIRLEDLSEDLKKILFTMWGPSGNNGMYSKVNALVIDVAVLKERDNARNAIAAERERGAISAGREDRSRHRRREDRVAFGEENPESD